MCDHETEASKRLRDAVGDAVRVARANEDSLETMSASAFRSVVAERLRSLERDVAEVRTRVNGLLFVVTGAVATQVILRLFG